MTESARSYITDPKALRALSHPTRWTIIEVLGAERTATATRCAEYSGESVASCSYHLGMLTKYGFVEPVEGADGREKPWRLTRRDQSWRASDLEPDAAMAAETLSEVLLDHETAQMKDWIRRASREPEWQEAAGFSGRALYCTPDELVALRAGFDELLEPFLDRDDDPAARPDGARLVRPPSTGSPAPVARPTPRWRCASTPGSGGRAAPGWRPGRARSWTPDPTRGPRSAPALEWVSTPRFALLTHTQHPRRRGGATPLQPGGPPYRKVIDESGT